MAAHEELAASFHRWSVDPESKTASMDYAKSLELGMRGMSLIKDNLRERAETAGSVASSSPPVEPQELSEHRLNVRRSAPSSPDSESSSQQHRIEATKSSGAHPSPIGKATAGPSSKNSSASSPLLTLTPNSSSVDASTDWHSLSGGMPSLPFSQGESSSFGNFNFASSGDNNGLGFGGLRDRAHSSPGPVLSSSPPISVDYRSHFAAHTAYDDAHQERPRSVPRDRPDRPPLSQSYQEGGFVQGDRSNSNGFSQTRRSGSEGSFETGFGAVGRRGVVPPEYRPMQNGFDTNRRRASSGDDYHNPYSLDPKHVSQKFGSLPTLGSHIQQQRLSGYDGGEQLERPRHIRSVSQPLPAEQNAPSGSPPDQMYYQEGMAHDGHLYSGGEFRPRSHYHGSQSQPSFAAYDGYSHQKRVSMPNLSQSQSYGQFQNFRGSASDYQGSPHSHSQGSVMASAEDMRAFSAPSMISPGQSPIQMYYGGSHHSRNSSDGGSTMLSTSPMSMSGLSRGGSNRIPRHHLSGDEELTHPLVGEHIEVPDHEDFHNVAYGNMQQRAVPRNPTHGHSMSLGQLPSYTDQSQHLAGGMHSMPKVVYAVKFKRTQRNFVIGPRITRDLKMGTYVKVEADRGEDLGIVVGKVAADKYNLLGGRAGFQGPPSAGMGTGAADLKRISRLATHEEVSLLSLKREEEDELLAICRGKVRQRGLPMHVVDAEYQFDRHKLTFFFEAEGRIDFRELVRDLFSMYKTRIWMQQIDKSTASSAQAMMAPTASAVQMDYGIPIIAPASEFADSIVLGGFGEARSH